MKLGLKKIVGVVIREPRRVVEQPVGLPEWIPRPPLTMKPIPTLATNQNFSSLRPSDVRRIRAKYFIPEVIALGVPDRTWRASRPPIGWICLYEEHLKACLRFSLHPFIPMLLNEYRVPLAQIVPNGIRILIKFFIIYVEHGIEPTIELFRFCFQLRKAAQCLGYKTFHARSNLKIITPDNNAGWRPRYLFAQVPGWEISEE